MTRRKNKFLKDESGAITVDWVVLTGMVLAVLFGALTTFMDGTIEHAELTSATMNSTGIVSY